MYIDVIIQIYIAKVFLVKVPFFLISVHVFNFISRFG